MKVLQVEAAIVEKLKSVVGEEGSRLNPIQDINGNWFITAEEYYAKEFQKFFQQDGTKIIEIDYVPKPYKDSLVTSIEAKPVKDRTPEEQKYYDSMQPKSVAPTIPIKK